MTNKNNDRNRMERWISYLMKLNDPVAKEIAKYMEDTKQPDPVNGLDRSVIDLADIIHTVWQENEAAGSAEDIATRSVESCHGRIHYIEKGDVSCVIADCLEGIQILEPVYNMSTESYLTEEQLQAAVLLALDKDNCIVNPMHSEAADMSNGELRKIHIYDRETGKEVNLKTDPYFKEYEVMVNVVDNTISLLQFGSVVTFASNKYIAR